MPNGSTTIRRAFDGLERAVRRLLRTCSSSSPTTWAGRISAATAPRRSERRTSTVWPPKGFVSPTAMRAHRGVHRRGSVSTPVVSPVGCRRAWKNPSRDGPRRTAFRPTTRRCRRSSPMRVTGRRCSVSGIAAGCRGTARYASVSRRSSATSTARWTTSSTSTLSANPISTRARPRSNKRGTTRI